LPALTKRPPGNWRPFLFLPGPAADDVVERSKSWASTNDEANRLAHELAQLTGESLTTAVTVAVRERLERLQRSQREPSSERILQIGKDCAVRLKQPCLTVDHAELLYDENGLPK
jgi:antitoxin VapB